MTLPPPFHQTDMRAQTVTTFGIEVAVANSRCRVTSEGSVCRVVDSALSHVTRAWVRLQATAYSACVR